MRGRVFQQFEGMTITEYHARYEDQARAIEEVSKYVLAGFDPLSPRGLTFVGPTGVGKTMLACIVLNAANDCGVRTECIEMSSYIRLFQDKFDYQEVVSAGDEDGIESFMQIRRRLAYIQGSSKKGAQLLLLDDVGREHESSSGWSDEQLFDTIRFRFNRGMPTMITSNLDLDELESRYTKGLSSFLREATQIIRIVATDFREEWAAGH